VLVGGVGYAYHLGEVEITVGQYVEFLNTVDPAGRDRHDLYTDLMSPSSWPKYGSITRSMGPGVGPGRHYSVAYPQWTNKPFGFANFLRAARFVNSLFNGDASSLNPDDGDVVNAATQPLSTYSPEAPNAPPGTFPTWCPPQAGEIACNTVNPLGLPPATYQSIYQGNLSTVGQALTTSPWGTRDQGGNAVEWTDTIAPSPFGPRTRECGDGCTVVSPTHRRFSSGFRRSVCNPRTSSSSPTPIPGWASASA